VKNSFEKIDTIVSIKMNEENLMQKRKRKE
jgi:hypothetical protein